MSSGRLVLAPRGLSPRQKRQALLDAPTTQAQPRRPQAIATIAALKPASAAAPGWAALLVNLALRGPPALSRAIPREQSTIPDKDNLP